MYEKNIKESGWYSAPLINDVYIYGEVYLSVVFDKDGKCGLIQTDDPRSDNDRKTVSYQNENVVVDFIYDDLTVVQTMDNAFLRTTFQGRQGIIALYSTGIDINSKAVAREIFSCVYSKIEIEYFNSVILLKGLVGMQYYNINMNEMSGSFDSIKLLSDYLAICKKRGVTEFYNLIDCKLLAHFDSEYYCNYICSYVAGDVFILYDGFAGGESTKNKLIFYSWEGDKQEKIYETEFYDEVKVFGHSDSSGCFSMTGCDIIKKGKVRRFEAIHKFWSEDDIVKICNYDWEESE